MDESLREAALDLIEAREQALVSGDREAFLETVAAGSGDFAETQARWFDNLAELPATDVSLTLGDEDVMTRVHGEGDLQLPVDFTMRLDGFDEQPVTQPMIYTFERDGDEALLTSDRNVQSDALTGWVPAPWDVAEITVKRSGGVLGVFDESTSAQAHRMIAEVRRSIDDIDATLPPWSGSVVVYAISDEQAMDRMSLMELADTAGVAFPVLARPRSKRVAGWRFMVNPDAVQADHDRLQTIRHELAHVAMGKLAVRVPTWLSEGAAEHVARSVFPLRVRLAVARDRLRGRRVRDLESGRDFYQVQAALNYEMAQLACDYLATTHGTATLWRLMKAFRRTRIAVQADIDAVTRRELGMDTTQLARAAAEWAAL